MNCFKGQLPGFFRIDHTKIRCEIPLPVIVSVNRVKV